MEMERMGKRYDSSNRNDFSTETLKDTMKDFEAE